MARIPDSFIRDLLQKIDLESLVSQTVSLTKQSGSNRFGLCPFHGEKTPSFSVRRTDLGSGEPGFYYCFGCGRGGDAIRFISEREGLHYREAIEWLANWAGMTIPTDEAVDSIERNTTYLNYQLLTQVSRYYQAQLISDAGRLARAYLKKRGLPEELQLRYGLGYAPGFNMPLLDAIQPMLGPEFLAQPNQHPVKTRLIEVGLLTASKQYSYFLNRLIFPVHNAQGQVIAFGGRELVSDQHATNHYGPKYLNSPETTVYHKSNHLYGLYQAKRSIARTHRVFVVEGYIDVLQLVRYGFEESVAILGTAISATQLELLHRIPNLEEIIFCFDGDSAGQKAAFRALELALSGGVTDKLYRFCELPDGLDPDTSLTQKGKPFFEQRVQSALPLSKYLFLRLARQVDLSSAEGRLKFSRRSLDFIQTAPDLDYRKLLREQISESVGFDIRLSQSQEKESTKLRMPAKKFQNKFQNQKTPPPVVCSVALRAFVLLWQNPEFDDTLVGFNLKPFSDLELEDLEIRWFYELSQRILQFREKLSYAELKAFLPNFKIPESNLLVWAKVMSDVEKKQEFIACLNKLLVITREKNIEKLIEMSKQGNITYKEKQLLLDLLQQKKMIEPR